MEPVLGLVTIGQTPRPDFEREFRRHVLRAEIRIRGALDDLSEEQIDELVSIRGEYPLLVRLATGRSREVQRDVLHPRIERAAADLAADGAQLIVVLCAGAFPEVKAPVPVLLPGRLLPGVAAAVAPTTRIGVVTPVKGQAKAAAAKWQADGFAPLVTWASPFNHAEIERAAEVMTSPDISLVVLDCMGHGPDYKQEFVRLTGKPTLLAQSVMARIAGELMEG